MLGARLTAVGLAATLLSAACLADEASVRDRLADLEFQRSDTIGRVTRARSLSLLTIAETRGSRFFLGVNSDGLFGLHFGAAQRRDRYLEVARMPYLSASRGY